MLSLLLSTLEMMALTFIIGFVVAGVIKLIAVWADSLEFHHNEELSQFSKLNKLRAKIGEILGLDSVNEEDNTGMKKKNRWMTNVKNFVKV